MKCCNVLLHYFCLDIYFLFSFFVELIEIMPLFAPVLSEVNKFIDPMKESRIIQRSEWLFELEVPIRNDMVPGMVFIKEYGGQYTVKMQLLHKKFPDGYLFVDEFKAMAADQHVYINKHDHERWLKNFMNPREQRAPTPTKTPPYSSSQVLSDTPAQGPFTKYRVEGPLRTSKYPQRIDPNIVEQHPKDAKVQYDYEESRPMRDRLGLPPDKPSPFPRDPPAVPHHQPPVEEPQQHQQQHQEEGELSGSDNDMDVSPPPSAGYEVVGGSSDTGSVETYPMEEMLTWTFKRLGNRRSRLVKMQKKAKDAGRLHTFAIVTEQLRLITKCQRINKFGSFATNPALQRKNVDMDADDNSSVVAEVRAKQGIPPPLKRPGTIYPTRKEIAAQRAAQAVCIDTPLRPFKRDKFVPPSLPPRQVIISTNNNNNVSNSLTDQCTFFDESPIIFKRLATKIKIENKTKNKINTNIKSKKLSLNNKSKIVKSKLKKSRAKIVKKAKPVQRSYPSAVVTSPVFNQGGFNISLVSQDSLAFSEGSPNDPKVYLGGRFSDQSDPDSPTTAARINAKALWYEPCTRLEYRYKLRAWQAEGLPGRPTNSPLKFSLPN